MSGDGSETAKPSPPNEHSDALYALIIAVVVVVVGGGGWSLHRAHRGMGAHSKYDEITVGGELACGRRAPGVLGCWDREGGNVAPLGLFQQVTASDDWACGRKGNGRVKCFARDEELPVEGRFSQIDQGPRFACGVVKSRGPRSADSATVSCWDRDGEDVLAEGRPTAEVSQIAVGGDFACALLEEGNVHCWGARTMDTTDSRGVRYDQISAGDQYACGVTTEGDLECWGPAPPPRVRRGSYTKVTVGANHHCGLEATRQVECWAKERGEETAVPADSRFDDIDAGACRTCGRMRSGQIACWGCEYLSADEAMEKLREQLSGSSGFGGNYGFE